ncbi:hypothetical protein TURU_040158 [Turdus rufiventris]|nr:hypothetical protein TURU_040158 [Turdus rufiventris]
MDKLTIISGCLFLAADIFAIASLANPDWINTGESAGALTVGLVRQCQTIHGRDRTCIPPRLPPEWVTTLFFIIMGIISLTVTCGLLVASHWRREATKYARWIAFTGNKSSHIMDTHIRKMVWLLNNDQYGKKWCVRPPWQGFAVPHLEPVNGLLGTQSSKTQDVLVDEFSYKEEYGEVFVKEEHTISAYVAEACGGFDLQLHVCLFSVTKGTDPSGMIPARYANPMETATAFKEIVQAARGRFDWFGEADLLMLY